MFSFFLDGPYYIGGKVVEWTQFMNIHPRYFKHSLCFVSTGKEIIKWLN